MEGSSPNHSVGESAVLFSDSRLMRRLAWLAWVIFTAGTAARNGRSLQLANQIIVAN